MQWDGWTDYGQGEGRVNAANAVGLPLRLVIIEVVPSLRLGCFLLTR